MVFQLEVVHACVEVAKHCADVQTLPGRDLVAQMADDTLLGQVVVICSLEVE